ncbi:MAG: hypothetical protein LCH77_06035 [Actinobacteria bacterium]|uniref:Peptidase C39-like domain-containing protein n=1 Tax=Nostocoides veronense TaxID=330836 RepID=A0ABP4Y148_9MICO|nr:hypothetical protein [Actinomycetota bacterium]
MPTAYRLHSGDQAPKQQSQVTCGSACLTVARMLVDPLFARWVLTGEGPRPGVSDGPTLALRFAAYERIVHTRTNGLYAGGGRLNLPWPRFFGTPPWGAKKELEFGAARRGTAYDIEVLRHLDTDGLGEHFDRLLRLVSDGEPGLLYVGDAKLPRHVLLILPDRGDGNLEIYDPYAGSVTELTRAAFVARRIAIAGWDVPWFCVQPTGQLRERVFDWPADAVPA